MLAVELQPHLALKADAVVNRVGGVESRVVRLESAHQLGEKTLSLAVQGGRVARHSMKKSRPARAGGEIATASSSVTMPEVPAGRTPVTMRRGWIIAFPFSP